MEVEGDMRASALQRSITRRYPQIVTMMEFVRQQNNNGFCTLYAINNLIQCSPYLYDRRLYTVEDMVQACKQTPHPLGTCDEKGGFTLQAVRWLLYNHPYSLPKTIYEDRGLLINEFNSLRKEIFSRQAALADLESKVMIIGFLCLVGYPQVPEAPQGIHAIAIVNLQPFTIENVNFVVIDSNFGFVSVTRSYDNLVQYLEKQYVLNNFLYPNDENPYTLISVIKKRINDSTAQELKNLHEESETPLEAGHSYYQF